MGFFKNHPKRSAVLVLIFVTLPSQIDAYWGLYEKFKGVSMPSLNLGFWIWLLPVIGVVLAIIIIRQGRQVTDNLQGTKQPLPNLQRERDELLNGSQQNDVIVIKPQLVMRIQEVGFGASGDSGYPLLNSDKDKARWIRLGLSFEWIGDVFIETLELVISGKERLRPITGGNSI